jgi:hypothetical protein
MTKVQKLGYLENMRRLQAKRTRERLEFSQVKLSVDGLYNLILAETEDEAQAEKAARDYMAAQLRAGKTPT